jgi:hypothetical protein
MVGALPFSVYSLLINEAAHAILPYSAQVNLSGVLNVEKLASDLTTFKGPCTGNRGQRLSNRMPMPLPSKIHLGHSTGTSNI